MYYSGTSLVVRNIIFFNVAVFLAQNLASSTLGQNLIEELFALNYFSVVYEHRFWQTFTYMFLHGGFWHLLFNMMALFFIGTEIERFWGPKPFLIFYLSTGWGAGITILLFDALKYFFSTPGVPLGLTVGASGAIFALILVYSILFQERRISLLLFFIFPVNIKAKNLLLVSFGLTVIIPFIMGGGPQISHVGHIGGILSGLVFLISLRNHRVYASGYNCLVTWYRDLTSKTFVRRGPKIVSRHFNPSPNLDESLMTEDEIEEKIDELLDIIAERGISGLDEKEKKFLERVSYLYRHKFPN